MAQRLFFGLLLMSLISTTQADTSYAVVSLATTKHTGISSIDFRGYQNANDVWVYYSLTFMGGRDVPEYIPGGMLGVGLQLPRQQDSVYFYSLGTYLVFDENDCDSGSSEQRAECIDRQTGGKWDVGGNYLVLQPEMGLRLKIGREVSLVGALRYWFSNDESLNQQLGLSIGVKF